MQIVHFSHYPRWYLGIKVIFCIARCALRVGHCALRIAQRTIKIPKTHPKVCETCDFKYEFARAIAYFKTETIVLIEEGLPVRIEITDLFLKEEKEARTKQNALQGERFGSIQFLVRS